MNAIEDIIAGDANQAGEDNRNVARMAALLAGLPVTVAGNTVNRLCASGLQAIMDAARAIMCNEGELYIAGGVESMTRAPFVMAKAGSGWSRTNEMHDSTIGWRFVNKNSPINTTPIPWAKRPRMWQSNGTSAARSRMNLPCKARRNTLQLRERPLESRDQRRGNTGR